jgi:hypothetical protein
MREICAKIPFQQVSILVWILYLLFLLPDEKNLRGFYGVTAIPLTVKTIGEVPWISIRHEKSSQRRDFAGIPCQMA